jgi:hypothetical protein
VLHCGQNIAVVLWFVIMLEQGSKLAAGGVRVIDDMFEFDVEFWLIF